MAAKKPKAPKPKLIWTLHLWPTDGADARFEGALFDFPATTQLGAMRKVRKAISDLRIDTDDGGRRRSEDYRGSLKGELLVGIEGSDAEPQSVMAVERIYWFDKPTFKPLDPA